MVARIVSGSVGISGAQTEVIGRAMRELEFVDLGAQQRRISAELKSRIDRVLNHGQYILGPETAELERALEDYADVSEAVSCSSGTDALLMVLMAREIGPGDAVFTTPFTFISTAEVVLQVGATPVFVDIDQQTFNLDPEALRYEVAEVSARTNLNPAAVIPVDLFGLPADYARIAEVANELGLFVIQDAAQSFGASRSGTMAGAHGDVAAVSFFPSKPLGCYGDGGAVLTGDDDLAERLRSIRVHGQGSNKYENLRVGLNARLDTLQAAVLLAKLTVFDDELRRRRSVAERYSARLHEFVDVPKIPGEARSSWAQYTILVEDRDTVADHLKERGIPTGVYYRTPLHLQPVTSHLGYERGDLPVSEQCADRVLSLPMHPYLTDDEIQAVCDALQEAICLEKVKSGHA